MEPTVPADDCPYCTDTTEYGSLVNFPCGHTVHYTCFIKAVRYNREHNEEIRCPLCRATVQDAVVPEMFGTVVVPVVVPALPQIHRSAESMEDRRETPISRVVYICGGLIVVMGVGYLVYATLF